MPQLSMPLFVNPADVILRMQLDSTLEGTEAVVESAIIAAQLHIQGVIGGDLLQQQQDSLFYCDSDAFSALQPGGFFRLELPSGWIRQDSAITINFGNVWQLSDAQTAPSGSYTVDFDRGYVLMDSRMYADKYVQVICTTGFNPSVATPTLPLVPVPSFSGSPIPYADDLQFTVGQVCSVQTPVTQTITLYLCIATPPSSGWNPPDSLYWQEIVYVPVTPTTYDPTVAYNVNDVVYFTVASVVYVFICIVATTAGIEPTVTTNWTQVIMEPEQIPQMLYEAIMSEVPGLLNADQSTNRNAQATPQYKALTDHAQLLLKRYFRLKGFSFRPVN
jgi:hypothetical protein